MGNTFKLMGGESTSPKSPTKDEEKNSNSIDSIVSTLPSNNGMFIPPELIQNVISRSIVSSMLNIRLVCRGWNAITQTLGFFKEVYDREGIPWESIPDHIKYSDHAALLLYVALKQDGFRKNFVANSSGEHGMEHWGHDTSTPGVNLSDYFRTENPPIGCSPLPSLPNSCFATSYVFVAVSQMVKIGVTQEIFNMLTPLEIRFSVCTAARFDCGGIGSFTVEEMNNRQNSVRSHSAQLVNRLRIEMAEGEVNWERHTFSAFFPAGRKYASPKFVIYFGAKDTKFWAGHYGLKFAHIEAKVKLLDPEGADDENPEFPRTEIEPRW